MNEGCIGFKDGNEISFEMAHIKSKGRLDLLDAYFFALNDFIHRLSRILRQAHHFTLAALI
jgi:hypothetical protein